MGKSFKRKRVGSQPNTNKILKLNDQDSNYIDDILKQLNSELIEDREIGLNLLSCQNNVQEINQHVIKAVGVLLTTDSDLNIKHAAAGTLRNFSCINPEFCEFMANNNVIQYLNSFITENENKIDTEDGWKKIFLEIINTLWNLCENSETALSLFNREKMELKLIKHINNVNSPINKDISIAVAQCLYSVSEDNSISIKNKKIYETQLKQILQPKQNDESIYIKTLAVGIMLNVGVEELFVNSEFVNILLTALEINLEELINKDDENVENLINCQTLALEIFNNSLVTVSDIEPMEIDDQPTTFEFQKSLMLKILSKIGKINDVKFGQKILKSLTKQRTTALICLQNFIEANNTCSFSVWESVSNILQEVDLETNLLEAVTCAMRAIITFQTKNNEITNLEIITISNKLNILFEMYEKSTELKICINLIKIIGGIGILFTNKKQENSTEIIKKIGFFLFSVLQNNKQISIVAETLDTIFDVFAEDDFNFLLFNEFNAIHILQQLLPQFNKMVREKKKKRFSEENCEFIEFKVVIETALENLPRFILYKKNL